MVAISIRGLSKSYGGETELAAVSDLSIDITTGQFVTLLGPSGCGKTTTLRLIAGFIAPEAGTIRIGEQLISSPDYVLPPEQRAMGMVFQNYAVWPHKTVYENVVFGLKLRGVGAGESRARVERTLALVNMTGFEHRLPNELSGGQQQRVALARSLVVEPKVLLLDEPLSNLDAKLRERMRGELKQLQRGTGITFVYVTHDQAEALALSDKIAVMQAGRLQQFGTPQEVYGRPASRAVADFMGLINLLPGTVVSGEAGRMTLRIGPSWTIELEGASTAPVGADLEIAVRPEDIRLQPPSANPRVTARIADRTYLGSSVEYHAILDGGMPLRVQTHPRELFATGDTVEVHVDTRQVAVFDAAGSAVTPKAPA
jgi:iron(III) transport system ATP-binding protein